MDQCAEIEILKVTICNLKKEPESYRKTQTPAITQPMTGLNDGPAINQWTGDGLWDSICGSISVVGCKTLEIPLKELAVRVTLASSGD